MREEASGMAQEIAPVLHEHEVVVGLDAVNPFVVELQERRTWQGEEERGVGGDDDLASFACHRIEQGEEPEG